MSKLKLLFYLLLLGGIIDIGRYFIYPNISDLKEIKPIPTAFMEYRQEEWAEQNRDMEITHKWVPMTKISPNVIKAVLIGEDDKFWNHDGFDVKGMEDAIERSLKKGSVAGGSTISQQLSKNLYLSPSKNPVRKVKEAIITWRIENTLSKRRILEIYLNVAEWGDGIFGIEAAARHYYHKSAKNLTGREAARLAAVLPNPIKYNPTGSQKYVKNRARIIYKIMQRRGVVIPQFQEVMSPPKVEDQTGDISENNESITELFGETATPDEEAASSETTTNLPDANEEDNEGNRSLTF
ncbi:monofunctional biosynthetic peptidoglycan transglycosylase [Sulfuricurvum sp. RIFCSPLOWO2_12_FULL_43_24]|uniref:monofunctional biosynthetic peptidoglycan transglycosylase n=1 Tax=Sulfuricurvum sp. RIFCSPLOWO2_12_FULL_43_24 TaxID=1802247 RepID=UPI0008D6BC91|nr:monofunctional biosynthetic peptidoglycan transglycosylase [Sulfuricurvum sp. RIFCSPLOWO2_12_FULL_43_24]OHD84316.1 MAG: monofunctional biosynthetic peptidoglycan transglycosylase [Sulfuricurvum sp. RIFCSPLOWO2_02_43_6]OHD86794.1 MAG: monofunctional biosynthetic peptidoglycan transglycosylase [Sulfuricurvum sp. RIFCSPLOWO2_02_FULL_43_45]OHD88478.1 MAG: monofunctional biosynthetic peptidoglycan transglycosylase [Sulfuricurvum sp. RIFCSPLOWO2_12_FULL_43_24]